MAEKTNATMAEKTNAKRMKVAQTSLTVALYVPNDEAHRVGYEQFDSWNRNVVKIIEGATHEIAIETEKFLKMQEPLKMHAPIEPSHWRQFRVDNNAQ